MTESYTQIPPDSSGKKLRTEELTVNGQDVHQEVVTLADAVGNILAPGLPFSRDQGNEQTAPLAANAAVSAPNGLISTGALSIATTTPYFLASMKGQPFDDSLGFVPAGAVLTAVNSSTSGTLSAPPSTFVPTPSTNDIFQSSIPPSAGSVFTGTWRSIQEFPSVLILWASLTQPWSVSLQWSPDGVNQDSTIFGTQPLTITQTNGYWVGFTVLNNIYLQPYYRIVVVNGGIAQTSGTLAQISFNVLMNAPYTGSFASLNSSLSLLSSALLTRSVLAGTKPDGSFVNVSLNSQGSLTTAELDPQSRAQHRTSLKRYSLDSDPLRLMGDSFTRGVDTGLWTITATTSGTITQGVGEQILDTGLLANGGVQMQTSRTWYYQSNTSHNMTCGVRIPDAPGTDYSNRRWGCYDLQNGYFFYLWGTLLGVGSKKVGIDTLIPVLQWNLTTTPYILDSNKHIYEIEYVADHVLFLIDQVAVHQMEAAVSTPRTSVLDFPLRFGITNLNNQAVSVKMALRECSLIRFGGQEDSRPRFLNISTASTTTLKPGPGTLEHVIVNTAQLGSQVQLFDSLTGSGTPIATIDTSNSAKVLTYDLDFSTGLTVVVTGSVPPDITIMFN